MALPSLKVRVTADTAAAEAGLERVEGDLRDVGAAADYAGTRTRGFDAQLRSATRTGGGFQRGIQNAAFQVGDFAVQVGAGTQASRALAMQLPQLLGGFGMLGAVMGAAAAIILPMAGAMSGLADSGRDVTEVFGTLQPLAQGIASAMGALKTGFVTAAEALINNLDRILITGGLVAGFFATKMVAGFVAARVATMTLAGAMTFLRGALIRTGIGALVVAVGEGVYQFTRIAKAAGGFGEALGLIGDVFGEVWGRIKTGISEMGNLFEGAGLIIQGALMEAFTIVGNAFTNNVINPIKKGLNEVIAIANSFGANMTPFEITDATGQGMGPMTAFSGRMMVGNAMDAMGDLSKPLESVGKIRDLLAEMKEEGITLPDILGLGEGGGEGGKKKSLSDKLSDQEKRIAEHLNRIKALTQGTLSDKLGAWGEYFGNLQTLTGNSSKKMLKVVKAFNAAQALMDAWGAYNKALNDPTPQPWWARLAGAANVLAAGIGAVNAIKSVGEGGAAGGAVAAGGAGGASAAAAPAPMRVTLEGIQPDSILTGSIVERLLDDLSDAAGDRGFTLLRAT